MTSMLASDEVIFPSDITYSLIALFYTTDMVFAPDIFDIKKPTFIL